MERDLLSGLGPKGNYLLLGYSTNGLWAKLLTKEKENDLFLRIQLNIENNYFIRLTFFVLFEKSNFLRKHHLLSCLPFKNV